MMTDSTLPSINATVLQKWFKLNTREGVGRYSASTALELYQAELMRQLTKKSVFIDVSDIKQDVGGAVDHLLPRKANFNERTQSSGLKV